MKVLGIEIPRPLLDRWRGWLAPANQPFFVDPTEESPGRLPAGPATDRLPDALHDTYRAWRIRQPSSVVWLDEPRFMELPRTDRARLVRAQVGRGRSAVPTVRRWSHTFDPAELREQGDGHRFVWWPSLVDRHPEAVLEDHVLDGQPHSRHREVSKATWRRCRDVLPHAEELAGTFSASARANCFGTTMAAVEAATADAQLGREPFEDFLRAHCSPGGDDDRPGTVLTWRDTAGLVCHSAVTLGDGWALEKPSQCWWTPRVVLDTRQLISVNRSPGLHLERHRLGGV